MKSTHAIPTKYDLMKGHSFNFIENEKTSSELVHEKNVGKIADEVYKYGHGNTETSTISKSHENLIGTQSDKVDREESSRLHKELAEKTETSIVTESRTDYSGSAPKRYTTKCYIKPVTLPTWYTESLFLHIGSTKRKYEEKIYFKNKLVPCSWSESMYTEIKTAPKRIISDIAIPVEESEIHFISLEPQQIAASAY